MEAATFYDDPAAIPQRRMEDYLEGTPERNRTPKDHRKVRITSAALPHDIVTFMAEEQPQLSDGLGGWATVARPDNVAMTDWNGNEPYRMRLALMLDDFMEQRKQNVSRDFRSILKLGRTKNRDAQPPRFRVYGKALPINGRRWVLENVEWGERIVRPGGRTVRQAVVLQMVEYIRPDDIEIRRKRKRKGKRGKSGDNEKRTRHYTVKKDDTLAKIAAKFYGDWQKWTKIAKANGIKNPRKLKVGTKLRIP